MLHLQVQPTIPPRTTSWGRAIHEYLVEYRIHLSLGGCKPDHLANPDNNDGVKTAFYHSLLEPH